MATVAKERSPGVRVTRNAGKNHANFSGVPRATPSETITLPGAADEDRGAAPSMLLRRAQNTNGKDSSVIYDSDLHEPPSARTSFADQDRGEVLNDLAVEPMNAEDVSNTTLSKAIYPTPLVPFTQGTSATPLKAPPVGVVEPETRRRISVNGNASSSQLRKNKVAPLPDQLRPSSARAR